MTAIKPLKLLLRSLLAALLLCLPACSKQTNERIEASGTVRSQGQPVDAGILLLTPKAGDGMPVSSRIEAGHFAFDAETGPMPGIFVASVNVDKPAIEELASLTQDNPRAALNLLRSSDPTSQSGPRLNEQETLVVISDEPIQTIDIELK